MGEGADARIDTLVVGAGVVGLAIARALAQAGQEVIVVDAAEGIGTGTSSRNSEVIHAGLYYPAGSAKARLCVRGRRLLYIYCAERGIGHRRCGKLVVAADESEVAALELLRTKALANGVTEVEMLDGARASHLEPALQAVAALHSTSTGIVDSHALMLALQGDAENAGTAFAFHAPFVRAEACAAGFVVDVGGTEPLRLATRRLVNAAGLQASRVAWQVEGLDRRLIPATRLCKGNYFALAGRAPFARLVYPVPQKDGLGVHYTIDLGGQGRFGPDVQWLPGQADDSAPDYTVDPARGDVFYAAIRRYWPALPQGALLPGYSGMRPKIHAAHEPAADFLIQGPAQHGVPGLVNLLGIESPGLTAALAIGEEIAALLA